MQEIFQNKQDQTKVHLLYANKTEVNVSILKSY